MQPQTFVLNFEKENVHSVCYNDFNVVGRIYLRKEITGEPWPEQVKITVEESTDGQD